MKDTNFKEGTKYKPFLRGLGLIAVISIIVLFIRSTSNQRLSGESGPLQNKERPAKDLTVDINDTGTDFQPQSRDQLDHQMVDIATDINLPPLDLSSNLSPQEIEQAIDVFSQERAMWAKFENLRGEVEIRISEDEVIKGIIEIRKIQVEQGLKGLPWTYELIITDKDNKWIFSSDGTSEGTQMQCDDKALSNQLYSFFHADTGEIIMAPHYILLSAYDDEFSPHAHKARHITQQEEFFKVVNPWHSRDVNATSDSYLFYQGLVPRNAISFESGHFSSWGKGLLGREEIKLSFKNYVESNGLWFPKNITIQKQQWKQQYMFKNIELNTLSNKSAKE